jgi:MutS domain V/MutS domain III
MSCLEEYNRRLRERESRAAHFEKLHIAIGNARLTIAVATGVLAWLTFSRHTFSPLWLIAPAGIFVVLVIYHSTVLRARALAERAATVYRNGLTRIQDRWAGTGQSGERFMDPHHVYSGDLDLFGRGSLFELLSTARTHMGEDTLAQWLLSPASLERIQERQTAISELRDQLDFREDLAVLGDDVRVGVHPQSLTKWAESPSQMRQPWIRFLSRLLVLAAIATAIVWGVWGSAIPFLVVVAIEASISYRLRNRLQEILSGAEHRFEDLDLLSAVLARLERETFHAPRLQALILEISSHQLPGSRAIALLRTIVEFINSRRNLIVRVLDVPLMFSVQVALAAEGWRSDHGSAVRSWLNITGEFEALISLAAYSYEHSADPFPELSADETCFQAETLAHPLIPSAQSVSNNVNICGETRLLLVSGSNMSGKSTLLRAVGINTVLAMAGAPVRARRLRLTPTQVGACIRINDSLQEGSSHFYAEIKRLRMLLDLANGAPRLLFLLDELLQGTNSSDRRIGAEGIVRAFLDRGAIGLVSTHDLALTDLGDSLSKLIHNVHFRDEMDHDKIRFDYKLREGIITKSNGLALMRSIGLEV